MSYVDIDLFKTDNDTLEGYNITFKIQKITHK